MSPKKKNSNNSFGSESYSENSSQNNELNQITFPNYISINENDNIISNNINESILGVENLINYSIYNSSYLNSFNSQTIKEIESPTHIGTKEKNNKEETTVNNKTLFIVNKYGRKKKTDNIKGEHNKYSDDILRRKVKCIILKSIMNFINEKIKEIYNGNIGHNIYKKELLTIKGDQNSNATIEYNQKFLYKTLGDIFSEKISSKYTNYSPNHNKILIKNLKNEEDDNKRLYFNNFFNLTFLQCLNHYIGIESIVELNGLAIFNENKNTLDEDERYIEFFSQYIRTYEGNIMKKKQRKKRKMQKSER